MRITTFSSREFNQDISKAKRAALGGPVFITDRGTPSFVLITIQTYQELSDNEKDIVSLLAMPGTEDIDFDPSKLQNKIHRPADFS